MVKWLKSTSCQKKEPNPSTKKLTNLTSCGNYIWIWIYTPENSCFEAKNEGWQDDFAFQTGDS